jgi:hypothetical protein
MSENLQKLTRCEELLAKVDAGAQLETDERRDVIAYLLATRPDMTNMDMARKFGVSEGSIRKDKDLIRKRAVEEVTKDDIGLVVHDIITTFDRIIADIEKSAAKSSLGTNTYLAHKKAVADYLQKKVEALQSLGYYPKNLGSMTATKFIFKSHVSERDGSVDTRAVNPDEAPVIDAEFTEVKPVSVPVQTRMLPAGMTEQELTETLKPKGSFVPDYASDSEEEAELRRSLAAEFAETAGDKMNRPPTDGEED